jgi:hypothetical protein
VVDNPIIEEVHKIHVHRYGNLSGSTAHDLLMMLSVSFGFREAVFVHKPFFGGKVGVGAVFIPAFRDRYADDSRTEHHFHATFVSFEQLPTDDGEVQDHLLGDSKDRGLFGYARLEQGRGVEEHFAFTPEISD